MVAIVSGSGFGIQNSSAAALGQTGVFGDAVHGTTKEAAYVNAANGNLVIQDQDDWLVSTGADLALTRTYNSQGALGTGSGWIMGPTKTITPTGTKNTTGSTATRTGSDGSTQRYTFVSGRYTSTDGAGAHDTLTYTGSGWTWQDGNPDNLGNIETYDAAGRLTGVGDGGIVQVEYTYKDGLLDTIKDAGGDIVHYDYKDGKVSRIWTELVRETEKSTEVVNHSRTYYAYENGRLASVTVDMTPTDGKPDTGPFYKTTYEYEPGTGRLNRLTQSDGTRLEFTYFNEGVDAGKIKTVKDALGRTTSFEYGTNTTQVTDPSGAVLVYGYDVASRLTSVRQGRNASDPTTLLGYDDDGNLTSTTTPSGLTTVYEYDTNGNRKLERDASGTTITRVYSTTTNLLTTETTTVLIDKNGTLAGGVEQVSMIRRFFYDENKLLRFIVSADGRTTEYTYKDRQLSSELRYNAAPATSGATETTLEGWAQSAAVQTLLATRTDYEYNRRGQVKQATNYATITDGAVDAATKTVAVFKYDPFGRLRERTEGDANTVTYDYDELGRLLTQKDSLGNTSTHVYSLGKRELTVTRGDDTLYTTTYSYDAAGQLTSVLQSHDGVAGTTVHEYDKNGRLRMSRDPMGMLAHVLYDSAGRKVAQVADRSLFEYVYNKDGQLIGTIRYATGIDPTGLVGKDGKALDVTLNEIRPKASDADRKSWNGYDKAGRLVATVDAMGALTRMEYDTAGRLVRTVARAKPVTLSTLVGNVIPAFNDAEVSADDRVSRVFYDNDGNAIAQLDASGYLTENTYNLAGMLVKTTTRMGAVADALIRDKGSLGQLQANAGTSTTPIASEYRIYGGNGLLAGTIDAAGYLTSLGYDAAGNLVSKRRHAAAIGNPDKATLASIRILSFDGADRITTYSYNKSNQLTRETSPLGDYIAYTYDASGKPASVTRGTPSLEERLERRQYDGIGRLTGELNAEGSYKLRALEDAKAPAAEVAKIWARYAIRYTYDLDGNRTGMTDALGNRTLYVYDKGRLAAVINAVGDWESRVYNAFGDLIEVARHTTPLTAGERDTVAASGKFSDLPAGAALTTRYYYDNDGRQAYLAEADGAVRQNVYDAFNQVTQTLQYRTPLSQVKAALGKGDIAAATGELAAALTGIQGAVSSRAYYDATGHLIYTVSATNAVEGRTYDAQGNVKSVRRFDTAAGALAGSSADLAMLAALAKNGLDRTQSFTYDLRGLLLDATDAAGFHTVSGYNAFGQRDSMTRYGVTGSVAASVLNSVTRTLYDKNGRVKATVGATGAVTAFAYDSEGRVTEQITFAKLIAVDSTPAMIQTALTGLTLSDTARDQRQRFFYDADGRLTATLTLQHDGKPTAEMAPGEIPGSWSVVAQTYDIAGRVAQRTAYDRTFDIDLTPSAADLAKWIAARDREVASTGPDSVHHAAIGMVRYAYDAAGRVIGTATAQRIAGAGPARDWAIVQLRYDSNGNVAQRTERAAMLTSASPAAADIAAFRTAAPTGTSDAITVYNYDAMGRVSATATALSGTDAVTQWAITTRKYDAAGNLLNTRQFATAYQGAVPTGALSTLVTKSPADRLTRYSYDAANRLVATVDATGSATRLDYDTSGNVVKSTRYAAAVAGSDDLVADFRPATADGSLVTRTLYDLNNRPAFVIKPDGAVLERRFDASGNVTMELSYATSAKLAGVLETSTLAEVRTKMLAKALPADRREYFVYDGAGQLQAKIDALGYISERQYDTAGRVVYTRGYPTSVTLATTASDTVVANTVRAAIKLQLAEKEASIRVTHYLFDAAGNLEGVTDALDKTEGYTYDALGNKLTFTNKLGAVWKYDYDAAGRLVRETSPLVETYADGLAAVIGNWGTPSLQSLVTLLTYDALGNLSRRSETYEERDKAGADGKVIKGTDHADVVARERVTEYRYDAVGRQVQTILPTVDVYDPTAEKENVWVVHARNEAPSGQRTITVTYNVLGDAVSSTDVGGRTSYKVYDAAGRVRYEIDAGNYATEYRYDMLGQVTSITRYGNVIKNSDKLATIDQGDVVDLLQRDDGKDRTISYTYDALGRKVKTIEPSVWSYDSLVKTGDGYFRASRTTHNEYNAFGEVFRQSVYGADGDTEISERAVTRIYYNARGEKTAQIAALSDTEKQRSGYLTTYTYDAAGNLKEQLEYAKQAGTWSDTTYSGFTATAQDRKVAYDYDALNRKSAETRLNVSYADGSQNATLVNGKLATSFEFDAVGNQIAVTDATGATTYTYYDALGHAKAVARTPGADPKSPIAKGGIKLTELKINIHGDVVLRIEYAEKAADANNAGYTAASNAASHVDNRVTATRYDKWGRALETLDAEQFATGRKSARMSYDVYGRMVKQWRSVTNAFDTSMTSFQIIGYDALGRIDTVTTPGLIDIVNNGTGGSNHRITEYNAFGEVQRTYLASEFVKNRNSAVAGTEIYTRYDRTGRAWLTNADNGVHTVRLYDIQGNVTASIQSTSTTPDDLKELANAEAVLYKDDVLRTNNRYDLLNHLVDSRIAPDPRLTVLVRDGETWVRKVVPRNTSIDGSLLVIGSASDVSLGLSVRYRVALEAWKDVPAYRIRVLDGVAVVDTLAFPVGEYTFEVQIAQPGGKKITRSDGMLTIGRPVNAAISRQLLQVYLLVLNRAPDLAGLNYYIRSMANDGLSVADVFGAVLNDAEAKKRFTGTPAQTIRQIFSEALGLTAGKDGDAVDKQIAYWEKRYSDAAANELAGSAALRGQVLADLVESVNESSGVAFNTLNNRTEALYNYVVRLQGSDSETIRTLMNNAPTNLAGAISTGNAQGTKRQYQIQLLEVYVVLFGRAADPGGLASWVNVLASGATLEAAVEGMLNDYEAQQPWLYPSLGLTPEQYNTQLVKRAYELSLNRGPGTTELNEWLTQLSGPNALGRGEFITRFISDIVNYAGDVAQRITDRKLFTNKVSVADAAISTTTDGKLAAGYETALLTGVTAADNAQLAAEKALAAAKAAAIAAQTASTAAAVAAAALPRETAQLIATRLYMALLGRVPDMLGLQSYLGSSVVSDEHWTTAAADLLDPKKEAGAMQGWRELTNDAFVRRLYGNLLGTVPVGAAVEDEIKDAVALLAGGMARATVAYRVAVGTLSSHYLNPAEQQAKTLLENRTAVALMAGLTLSLPDIAVQRETLSRVTATDMVAALKYAYEQSAGNVEGGLKAMGAIAAKAASLAAALNNAVSNSTAATTAMSALDKKAGAPYRLQMTQLYVALLGRQPDLAGLQSYVDANLQGAALVDDFLHPKHDEPKTLFPPTLGNAAFVDRVVAQALGKADLIDSGTRAQWAAKMAASPPATRGRIALDILNSIVTYTSTGNGASGTKAYLEARGVLLQKIADASVKLDNDTAAEVTRLTAQRKVLKDSLDQLATQLAPLQAAYSEADQARSKAVSEATSALTAANGKGDRSAATQLLMARIYATLLQKPASAGPSPSDIDKYKSMSAERIAQIAITSTDGQKYFPLNSSDTVFVTQLYRTILGREPSTEDLAHYTSLVASLSTNPNGRGAVAVGMINDLFRYTDWLPDQLTRKKAVDTKVAGFIDALDRAAGTATGQALTVLDEAKRLAGAVTAAQAAQATAVQDAKTAQAAERDGRDVINLPARTRVATIYAGLRGDADYAGAVFWIRSITDHPETETNFIQGFLDKEYPADATAFVEKLALNVLGRAGSAQDVANWVSAVNSKGRMVVTQDFLNSAEAARRLPAKAAVIEKQLKDIANAAIAALPAANSRVTAAAAKTTAALQNQQNYGWTVADAEAAYSVASGRSTTTTALVNVQAKVMVANDKFIAAENAKKPYLDKKALYDSAEADFNADPNLALLTKYEFAADLGTTIRAATAAVAAAADPLAKIATFSSEEAVNAQLGTQLYFTLFDRAPTLPELYSVVDRMAVGKVSLAGIADTLLRTPDGIRLYPPAQSNNTFVGLLYTNGLKRTADTDGLKHYANQLVGGASRADVVARFITGVNKELNSDTTRLNDRAKTMLLQLSTAPVTAAMVDAIMNTAVEQERQRAATIDAAGAAALAASPEAQRTARLTSLYVAIMNRNPDVAGLAYHATMMRKSSTMTIQAVAQIMLDSPEGQRIFASTLPAADFVEAFFANAFDRAPTAEELTKFKGMLPASTRGQVAVAMIDAMQAYRGTERLQQTTQLGFSAKLSGALQFVARQADADAQANQAAIGLLTKLTGEPLTKPVETLDLHSAVTPVGVSTKGSNGTMAGSNLITVDRWGNILEMADLRDPSLRITYQYNHDNQLIGQTQNARAGDTKVASASTRYDALGRVAAQVDYRGNTNVTTYDSLGNVVGEYHADTGVVASTYNLFGNRLTVKQPIAKLVNGTFTSLQTSYAYDHLGHLTSTKVGGEVSVHVAFNEGLNDFKMSDVVTQALEQTFTYDELGRQITNRGTDGVDTILEYDLDGNVIGTGMRRNAGDEPLYRTVSVYNAQHQKLATIDANDKTMSWQYADGRLQYSTDMGGKTTTYAYDQAGRLVTQTSTRGQSLHYTFTGANLTRVDDTATGMTTVYAYDAAGNRIRERQQYTTTAYANRPQRVQDNVLTYDAQNRVMSVKDELYTVSYEYDDNGNRLKITNAYKGGQAPLVSYNSFDAMNRQTLVDGELDAKGNRVHGSRGHAITYDLSGNRLSDKFKGTAVTYSNGSYGTTEGQDTTERYTYDAAGRLETVTRDALLIDVRRYDAGGRITQSGLLTRGTDGVADALKKLGISSAGRIYSYDFGGHITRQKELDANLNSMQDTYFVSDAWNLRGGYDNMGNLTGYTVVVTGTTRNSNGRYIINYSLFDTYKEANTTLANDNSSNSSIYDANGNRTSVVKGTLTRTLVAAGTKGDDIVIIDGQYYRETVKPDDPGVVLNRLWYDADGHVQSYKKGTADAEFNLIVNGQVLGEEAADGKSILGSTYLAATSAAMSAAPSSYSVQSASETLQSIAQNIWGDAKLWYLIADANALGADAKLSVGQILRIPARANTVHGDYGSYKPYDPSEQIGSTAPEMPTPQASKGGCGVVGQIIMIVVAVVVTAMTGIPIAGFMGTLFGPVGGAIATGAVAGAVGSIASQAVGIAIGAQDGFNWKAVALAAVSNGVAEGIGNLASPGGALSAIAGPGIPQAAARAALGSTVSQGVAVATGLQDHFSWRNVAASAAGGAVGAQVGEMLATNQAFESLLSGTSLRVARGTVSGFAAGMTTAVARGGKISIVQVATDAFGNALGQRLAEQVGSTPESSITIGGRNEHGMGLRQRGGFDLGGGRSYDSNTVSISANGIVDSTWAAGGAAMVDDLPDGMIGAPYPAAGVTLYEGNQVRYKTTYDANNYGWSIETDDGRQMLIRQRAWGPSGERPYLTQGATDEMPQVKFSYPSQEIGGLSEAAGPRFVAVKSDVEVARNAELLRNRNSLEISLLGPLFGAPGAFARVRGQSEARVSAANRIGGAAFELGMIAAGMPGKNSLIIEPVAVRPQSVGGYAPRDIDGGMWALDSRTIKGMGDVPLPLPDAVGPHSVIGTRLGDGGNFLYRQSATFTSLEAPFPSWRTDGKAIPWGRVDWTSHPYLDNRFGSSHPNPHIHEFYYDYTNKSWQVSDSPKKFGGH